MYNNQMLQRMQQHASKLEFEEAEAIKRKYLLLENYRSKSEVVSSTLHNIDVFNIENNEKVAYINYLHVTNGCITQAFTFEYAKRLTRTCSPQESSRCAKGTIVKVKRL